MTTSVAVDLRRNSIDSIRIFAAAQVAVYHVWTHIGGLPADPWFIRLIACFPGVPIFFFISGFVITAAWNRDPNVATYALARMFRILPAMYFCVLFSAAAIGLLYGSEVRGHAATFMLWIVAQLGLVTSWNPAFLRGFGVGVVNGSLWTIPVEVLFYVAAVAMLWRRRSRAAMSIVLATVAVLSLLANIVAHDWLPLIPGLPSVAAKMATVSPLSFVVWIWMFCIGGLASLWYQRVVPFVVDRFWFCVLALAVVTVAGNMVEIPGLLRTHGNNVGLLNTLALSATLLGFAFKFPDFGHRVLRGNDFSYGLYLFHMPTLNIALALGLAGLPCFAIALIAAMAMATLSWFAIERPMLGLSKRLRRRLAPARSAALSSS